MNARLARVLHTCDEALERGEAERAAYLDAACGVDAEFRREVEALLAQSDDSRDGFLAAPPWVAVPALAAGQRLGPYEVIGALGAGGMGAVYKALDTRLGRIVAIKIAGDGEMDCAARERFRNEARAVAAISHPNICAIYDVGSEVPSGGVGCDQWESAAGSADLVDFLVIEYVDGCTLADRIQREPLALHEALQVGIQVADALAAAHGRGIVHGDVKPSNIMLSSSPAGLVAMLLDFGLAAFARAADADARAPTLRESPAAAVTPPALRGTLPYLAPEQLERTTRDARGDLFALGCVLYEMLTGNRAFAGHTEADILSAIVRSEPQLPSRSQPSTPPALDRIVTRCLAKNPNDRCGSAQEVADELRRILDATTAANQSTAQPHRARRWLWVSAATLATLASVAASEAWRLRTPATVEPRPVVLSPPDRVAFGLAQSIEFSPDGRAVVYFGVTDGVPALYWQDLNEPDGHVIAGTESPGERFLTPFISPGGDWLGFTRGGRLMKLPIRSGRPAEPGAVVVDGIGWVRGASWGEDGTIVYCPTAYAGLWRVSASGGPARELTRPDPSKAELSHRWPQVLPGGRAALFTVQDASGRQDRSDIAVVELNSGRVARLHVGGSYGRYAPSGHLVYARNGSLLAVPFDLPSLKVAGSPVSFLSGVAMESAGSGSARFAISSTGTLVYEPAPPRPSAKNALIWVDRDGRVEPVTADRHAYQSALALSPDGQKLAVRIENAMRLDSQIWIYHIGRREWQQLTSEGDNSAPVFSPTGGRVVFASNREGAFNLYTMSADGRGPVSRLTRSPHWQYASSWSPDGRLLIYQEQELTTPGKNTCWVVSIADGRTWRWAPEDVDVFGARFSPDGRWITYQSQVSGRAEVYIRPFAGAGPVIRVSAAHGGSAPVWSRDGRSVLYLDGSTVMAARVRLAAQPRVSAPHLAFVLPLAPAIAGSANILALTPDGRRVALVQPDPQLAPQAHRLRIVSNWVEMLKGATATMR